MHFVGKCESLIIVVKECKRLAVEKMIGTFRIFYSHVFAAIYSLRRVCHQKDQIMLGCLRHLTEYLHSGLRTKNQLSHRIQLLIDLLFHVTQLLKRNTTNSHHPKK